MTNHLHLVVRGRVAAPCIAHELPLSSSLCPLGRVWPVARAVLARHLAAGVAVVCASLSIVMRYISCDGREVSRATVAGRAETGNVGRRADKKRTVQLTSATESSPSSRAHMRRVGRESHARRHLVVIAPVICREPLRPRRASSTLGLLPPRRRSRQCRRIASYWSH